MCEICEKEEELAFKTFRLNGGSTDLDYSGKLLSASSKKPTIRIKRLCFNDHHSNSIKLKGTSSIRKEREKAEKALLLNGCIKNAGFGIDSMHNFKDLRGGQSDTGDEQTLVIWTANEMDLSEIGSRLQAISEPLPYESITNI